MVKDFGFKTTLLVIESWEDVRRTPNFAEIIGCMLYETLFEECPTMKALFGFPVDIDMNSDAVCKSSAFGAQSHFLIGMMDRLLMMLGPDNNLLTHALHQLGERHANYGVEADMYPLMGKALLSTLEKHLGEKFTPETKEAWTLVYEGITNDMIYFAK